MKTTFALLVILLTSIVFAPAARADAGSAYNEARACYQSVKGAPSIQRAAWEECISKFEGVATEFPKSAKAPSALYSAARLRCELYAHTKDRGDIVAAVKLYNGVIRGYPKNSLADDSLYRVARLRQDPLKEDDRARKAYTYLIQHYPQGDMAPKARAALETMGDVPQAEKAAIATAAATNAAATTATTPPAGDIIEVDEKPAAATAEDAEAATQNPFDIQVAGRGSEATLSAIDIAESDTGTTITLTLTRPATYTYEFTGVGPRTQSQPKLDLRLAYTKPSSALGKQLAVGTTFVDRIKMKKQLLGSGVSLLIMLQPSTTYEIVPKGKQIIMRFTRGTEPKAARAPPAKTPFWSKLFGNDPNRLRIVIDPGHGGDDPGAIGPSGTKEKDVVLDISKRIATRLKKETGAKVYLTRSRDKTLTLEQRNAYAVSKKANLFISVHANASRKRDQVGIETYYLNNATDKAAAKLAARENRNAGQNLSTVEHILSTMLLNHDAGESNALATDVQRSMVKRVGKRYSKVRDRGVRSALFYVLVGAKCPAILVETAFISNPREEKRLKSTPYQEAVAISVADGVGRYLKTRDTRVTSL